MDTARHGVASRPHPCENTSQQQQLASARAKEQRRAEAAPVAAQQNQAQRVTSEGDDQRVESFLRSYRSSAKDQQLAGKLCEVYEFCQEADRIAM